MRFVRPAFIVALTLSAGCVSHGLVARDPLAACIAERSDEAREAHAAFDYDRTHSECEADLARAREDYPEPAASQASADEARRAQWQRNEEQQRSWQLQQRLQAEEAQRQQDNQRIQDETRRQQAQLQQQLTQHY